MRHERKRRVRSKRGSPDTDGANPEIIPQAPNRRVTNAESAGQAPGADPGRTERTAAGGIPEDLPEPRLGDPAAPGRPSGESFDPPETRGDEPPPPAGGRQSIHAYATRDLDILPAVRGLKDDPRPQGSGVVGRVPSGPTEQCYPLLRAQHHDRCDAHDREGATSVLAPSQYQGPDKYLDRCSNTTSLDNPRASSCSHVRETPRPPSPVDSKEGPKPSGDYPWRLRRRLGRRRQILRQAILCARRGAGRNAAGSPRADIRRREGCTDRAKPRPVGHGVRRGPLGVAWYLHRAEKLSLDQAYERIRAVRPKIESAREWIGHPEALES